MSPTHRSHYYKNTSTQRDVSGRSATGSRERTRSLANGSKGYQAPATSTGSREAGAAAVMSPGPRSLAPPPPLHPRSFKLRFAARGELGRSHFSAIKPLALPAPVTEPPQRRGVATPEPGPLRRVREAFERGPRDRHPAPLVSSHEYGWWAAAGWEGWEGCGACGARLDYRIRDSAWLKERVRVLASDAGYKR